MSRSYGVQKKDVYKTCWIVDSNLNVSRVLAEFKVSTLKWYYWTTECGVKLSSSLPPYYPTLGNGNASYWGDGTHYKTKKQALADRKKLLKTHVLKLKKEYRRKLNNELEKLMELE